MIELQLDDRRLHGERYHEDLERTRQFIQGRLRNLRELFSAGRGSWYVALDDGTVVASLGVVVTDGRARYQYVDTLSSHRRRGIASRLVVDAATDITARYRVNDLVIAADPDCHAIGLYEELGFRRAELACGAMLGPQLHSAKT